MRQTVYSQSARESANSGRSCVVLVTATQQCPGQLLSALARRGFHIHFAACPSDVFTHLATQSVAALVLINPAADTPTRQLVAALKRYFPHIACWQYLFAATPGSKPHLTRFSPDTPAPVAPVSSAATASTPTPATASPGTAPAAAPAQVPATPSPTTPAPTQTAAAQTDTPASATPEPASPDTEISPGAANRPNPIDLPLRITQEELDMLLGPLPEPDEDFDDGL